MRSAHHQHAVDGFLCVQDALSVYRHVREVHSGDSIQEDFVMHLETGRIFLNVSLYRHVLECGYFGCTAFVGWNSSLEDAQVSTDIAPTIGTRVCCSRCEPVLWIHIY